MTIGYLWLGLSHRLQTVLARTAVILRLLEGEFAFRLTHLVVSHSQVLAGSLLRHHLLATWAFA